MSTGTLTTPAGITRSMWGGSARRIAFLARGEAILLRRNPMALIMAVVMPVATVLIIRSAVPSGVAGGGNRGEAIVTMLTAFALVLVVYYNLVTAVVARREELVLKRLRTGELNDAEIFAGTAAPAVALAWGQILLGILAAVAFFGLGVPTNALLVLAATILGTAVFVLLALVSTVLTRNVDMAQVTTTPILLVPVISGVMIPLDVLPEPLQRVAQVLPMTPVVDLLRLGFTGITADGTSVDLASSFAPAAVPLLILTAWIVVAAWATRRWFRWEPRR